MNPHEATNDVLASPARWDEIAKDWLVAVIERTPLSEVEALPLARMSREAPSLIAAILGKTTDTIEPGTDGLPTSVRSKIVALAGDREASASLRRLPHELAALQTLMVEALDRETPRRDKRAFADAVVRLTEVFGVVQAAAIDSLVEERTAGAATDPETGLPGEATAFEWLRILTAEGGSNGSAFSIAHIGIDGIERIAKGYGEEASSQMITAVTDVVGGQLRRTDRAFRIGHGQLLVVAPGTGSPELEREAREISALIAAAQGDTGPRVSVNIGIANFPANGDRPSTLLEAAEEAAWAAQASGEAIALAGTPALQDH